MCFRKDSDVLLQLTKREREREISALTILSKE